MANRYRSRALIGRRSTVAAALAASVAPVLAVSQMAMAGTKTFSSANQAWLTTTNWTPNGLPTLTDDILINAGLPEMTLSNGAIDAQYITFSNPNNRAIGNATGLAGNSTITLHGNGGVNPLISVTGAGTFNIKGPNSGTGTGTLGVALNASGQFSVTGTGALTIGGVISETGGPRSLEKVGTGTLTLSGANTFTGDFSIVNGVVNVNSIGNTGAAQSMGMSVNAVTLGGASTAGTLNYTGAGASSNRGFTLGAAGGGITTANGLTLSGVVAGGGAFTKGGAGELVLSGATGAITGASAININLGVLRLDNTVNNNDRIGNSTALNFNGGKLEWNSNLGAPTLETAGAMNVVAGANTFNSTINSGFAGDGVMTFASLSRSAGATMSFLISDGGFAHIAATPTLSNGILGGWATHNRSDWATIDENTGRVVGYTGYTTASDTTTWTSTQNVTVDGARGVTQNTTVHSLRFTPFASPATVSVNAGTTLRVDNGLLSPDTGHVIAGPGSLTAGTAAGSELIVTVPYDGEVLSVTAPIVNNSGGAVRLVKSGDGILELDAANTYTGNTDVLAGVLRLGTSAGVAATQVNVAAGASLDVNGQTKSIAGLNGAGNVNLGAGTLTFGSNGSNTTVSGVISGANGSITKTGTGTTALTGVNTFTGVTNIGNTNGVDAGGVLVVDADSRFGAAPGAATPGKINLYNATLRFTGATTVTTLVTSVPVGTRGVLVTANRGVTLNPGNGKFDVPTGDYAEIQGIIADGIGGTSPLHKIGGGTLDLRTATNTFTGGVIIDGGTLGVNKDTNFGAPPLSSDADAVQLRNGATIKWYSSGAGPQAGMVANRGLTIGTGGGILDYSLSSGVPNLSNPVTSAPGNTLTKIGTNTLQSNIAQPDMNGDLVVGQGRWNTHNSTAAGNGTIYLSAPDIAPATAAGLAQLGIGGTDLGLSITLANNIVLNPTGQGLTSFEVNTTNTLTINGVISGTGGLNKGRTAGTTGVLALGGNNTYTGETTVLLGTLQVSDNTNLGNAANGVTLGGSGAQATLKLGGNVSAVGRTLTTASGGGVVDTNGFNATFGNATGTANLVKNSLGTLVVNHARVNNLTVNAGTLQVAPSSLAAGVSKVAALTIAPGARLDLTDNKLITTTALGTEAAGVYSGVQGMVQSASNGGLWTGSGLTTSLPAAATGLTSIGTATGAQLKGLTAGQTAIFAGQTITDASTVAMYTYGGDANLDGFISGDDYSAIDFNIAVPGADGWFNGDFNYDGIISGDDYSMIDFNIVAQGAPFSTSGSAGLSGVTAVPEPASLGVVSLAAAAMFGRRRRKS